MTGRHEFVVDGPVDLDVRIDAGRLIVTSVPGDQVVVVIDGREQDWDVSSVGASVTVAPVRERWRSRTARVSVEVPDGTRVVARSASGDVRLDGAFGDVEITTASGDVSVGTTAGLEASTASGDLRVRSVDGDLRVVTLSGDVRVGDVAGSADITTAAGDVRIDRVGSDLTANSTAGDLRIEYFGGSELAVKTVAGDLDVGLPAGIRVRPQISTFSGSTRLPEADRSGTSAGERRRVGVAFKSISGDLTIRRV